MVTQTKLLPSVVSPVNPARKLEFRPGEPRCKSPLSPARSSATADRVPVTSAGALIRLEVEGPLYVLVVTTKSTELLDAGWPMRSVSQDPQARFNRWHWWPSIRNLVRGVARNGQAGHPRRNDGPRYTRSRS